MNHRNIYVGYENPLRAGHIIDDAKPMDILQFVLSGKGGYSLEEHGYFSLCANSVFWLPKGKKVSYWPDINNRYEYFYLAVDVLDSEAFFSQLGFTYDRPVMQVGNKRIFDAVKELYESFSKQTVEDNFKGLSLIYEVFGLFARENPSDNNLSFGINPSVERALTFINNNYTADITFDEVANMVHLNRSYFCILFKEYTGLSPLQYLISLRISQACKLLGTDKTVTDVATATGFNSVTNFGVHFKRIMKMSPLEYKKYLLAARSPRNYLPQDVAGEKENRNDR